MCVCVCVRESVCVLTFCGAAAGLRAAGAAHVTAALLWTALTAADTQEDDEHQHTEDDEENRQPI